MWLTDGNVYTGQFVKGKMTGFSALVKPSGEKL